MLCPRALAPAFFLIVLLASTARAQDIPVDDAEATAGPAEASSAEAVPPPNAEPTDSAAEPELLGDEQALYEEEVGTEQRYSRVHPHEEPGRSYHFIGGFYRHHFLPSGIFKLFLDAAPSVNFPQFGGEYIHRKDNFDIIASVYYADFGGSGPFLAKGDPPGDLEWIDSQLWAVMGGVTFLWGTHFSDWFAIQYGLGVGVGALLGDLTRTEAYPTNGGNARCVAPTAAGEPGSAQPDQPFSDAATAAGQTIDNYCGAPNTFPTDADGDNGEHYGVNARTWLEGGSVPNLWFRFAPQISLRIKPMRHLLFRIDGGFDLFSGAFVGGALAVGF